MSQNNLKILLDNVELDIDANSDFPISFDYSLEDVENFQSKKGSEAIGIKIPATLHNQKQLNTLNNTSVEDTTQSQFFRGIRKFVAQTNGEEIFIGKAIPKKAYRKSGVPTSFELNAFGNNGDWIIEMKELTLFEVLKRIELTFDKNTIINSWGFDGTNENMPFVFAPVKYADPLDLDAGDDKNYHIKNFRPAISKFFTLYWAFQMFGYKVQSSFLDSQFYRRQVMPWTFGNFLSSEGTKYDIHRFLAKSDVDRRFEDIDDFVDLNVLDTPTPPCFDNNNTVPNGDYTYQNKEMKWKYNTPHYGPLEVTFSHMLYYDYKIDLSSIVELNVFWYKNGIQMQQNQIFDHQAPTFGSTEGSDMVTIFFSTLVNPNDEISCKVKLRVYESKTATVARCYLRVEQHQIDYFKIPIGGQVSFDSYLPLQKFKFLDFLRGEVDLFNLSFQTDPVNKVVLIEPTHEYATGHNLSLKNKGYFNGNVLDWTLKEDISKESYIEMYDGNAREFVFKFKDDSNDGALKIVQDRYKITLASGKYIFSERFKAEKKEFENRFYSPTMHYNVDEFADVTGEAPQMICLVPENISNTSSSESQNTFSPKSAYYKGRVSGVGGWRMKDQNGQITSYNDFPYLFAVNYKEGGQNDPILSYSDEKIGNSGNYVVGRGLIKRFFWQRLAIMNDGRWLNTNFMLNNKDISNWFHQERIVINGEKFELIKIDGYKSLKGESTPCILRKWVPITERESLNTYPSEQSILTNAVIVLTEPISNADNTVIDKVFDTQYNRLMCLYTDIPR
ncbi:MULTISPECIES: hypothetical protein [Chryseobacterium]|uniref:Uncharacterized protein n=1 Tax=Chryseobacterium gambrini TaxID=373672 RepID=A0A1N7LEE4_9FLAO|nr:MULTISPECIES: hypothetical protein [Chryseobacterium]SIS72151.1 hypothetical protein SAMN05421785_102177 [Chryseobacterium gambrini]